MQKKDPNVLFILVTSGSWSGLSQLPNVLNLQPVEYKKLPSFMAAADLCLSLYHVALPQVGFYNSSSKLFNYMAMGKPSIATDIGQMSTVIKPGVNGLLTNNNVDDVVQKILYLKAHKSQAAKMGDQARKDVIKYYNWDRAAKEIEEQLYRAIAKKQ